MLLQSASPQLGETEVSPLGCSPKSWNVGCTFHSFSLLREKQWLGYFLLIGPSSVKILSGWVQALTCYPALWWAFLIHRFICFISRPFGGGVVLNISSVVLFFSFRYSNYIHVIPSFCILPSSFLFILLFFTSFSFSWLLDNLYATLMFLSVFCLHCPFTNFSLHLWDNCLFLFWVQLILSIFSESFSSFSDLRFEFDSRWFFSYP